MKRNIILALMLFFLIGIYYFGKSKTESKVEENIKKESIKLFKTFSASSVKEISITNTEKNEKVEFTKDNDNWKVKDKNCNADKQSIETILQKVSVIRLGEKIGKWQPEYMQKYGFDKGLEIKIDSTVFNLGKQTGSRIALKHSDKLYLSPFRDKHVFSKYDNNWCGKEKKPEKITESTEKDKSEKEKDKSEKKQDKPEKEKDKPANKSSK